MMLTVEGSPVLPDDAHIPACLQQLVQGLAVLSAPGFAVQEEHIGALRAGEGHALEMLTDEAAGEVHITGDGLAELIGPVGAFLAVGTQQGVHGHEVHGIIVAERAFLIAEVLQPLVVDDVVAAHQARQVEGLAGGVHGDGPQLGVLGYRLGGDVLVAFQNDVRPDLVGDHIDIVLFVQLHSLLDLPALPDPAGGVVGGTENSGVDLVIQELLLHIGKVHPPDAILVQDQRGMDDLVAAIGQTVGKAYISRGVDQDFAAPGAEDIHSCDYAAQNAVFVANVSGSQTGDTVAAFLPADDGIEVFLPGEEVAEGGVLSPADHGFLDGWQHGEVHIGHPHGDDVKALPGSGIGRTRCANGVHGDGILAPAVQNSGEIVTHSNAPFCVGVYYRRFFRKKQ